MRHIKLQVQRVWEQLHDSLSYRMRLSSNTFLEAGRKHENYDTVVQGRKIARQENIMGTHFCFIFKRQSIFVQYLFHVGLFLNSEQILSIYRCNKSNTLYLKEVQVRKFHFDKFNYLSLIISIMQTFSNGFNFMFKEIHNFSMHNCR